ncbi:MAG: PAS domain-containing protein [Herpetosiphonaceae bacterium]|nr:PAS domain-containing protein [Herpetosiphonaceae bacterium]
MTLDDQLRTLSQRNAQLTELVALGTALQACDSLSGLAANVMRTIMKLTNCERVLLALVDREQQWLVPPPGSTWAPLSLSTVMTQLAAARKLGVLTHHFDTHAALPAFGEAVALTILDRQGQVMGLIVVDVSERTEPLDQHLVQLLEIVANQTAIAINNIALAAEQQQTVDRLTALNALSLAVNTAQLNSDHVMRMTVGGAVGTTEATGGGVLIVDKGEIQANYVLGLPGTIGNAVQSLIDVIDGDYVELRRESLPAAAFEAHIRRLIVVPMRGTKRTVGLLWLGFAQSTVTRTEREMAVLYAKMAGAVIENLNLFEEVRSAEERKAAILASTREGILMVDQDQRVSVVNSAFGTLLGVTTSRLIGLSVSDLCDEHMLLGVDSATAQAICEAIDAVISGGHIQIEGEFVVAEAVLLHVHWTVMSAHGDGGGSVGALLVVQDVTAARQIEKLRADTSSMIVHDLRAPLTNLMISVDLLTKQVVGPLTKEQGRILHIAAASCQQMLDMVNDLLDIRRLEAQTVTLNPQAAGLGPIVDVVIERLERVAHDQQISFNNQLDDTPPVLIDVELVRRILQNLMDNALKFSHEAGEITISSRVELAAALPFPHSPGEWVVVAVQDHGSGIPEAYRSQIFELFGQAPSGHRRGTGLGLAFCKLAVEAHGGRIWVESVVQAGSTFYFTVPVAVLPTYTRD